MSMSIAWNNFPFKVWFNDWNVIDGKSLAFTCIGIGSIAIFFEFLKIIQEYLEGKFHVEPLIPSSNYNHNNASAPQSSTTSNDIDLSHLHITDSLKYVRNQRIIHHISQTLLQTLKLALGYLLMLATMTYNGVVIISVIGGLTLGYFIFAPNEKMSNFVADDENHATESANSNNGDSCNNSDNSLQTLLPECLT